MEISKSAFGEHFTWGVSTAAYQIEGAYNIDGKGASIWDVFANTKGKIANNQNGNHSCDFYRRYTQDLVLMRSLNITNYRFSLSWSRLFPNGNGKVNYLGLDFYNRMIDFCLELGIEPWITLYHWDLPYELELKGGWTNRDIVSWFSQYAECCAKYFGDRVKHWMILNEPMVFTGAGYFLGNHAPGKKGLSNFLSAAHHAALCQAEGGRAVKSVLPHSRVGTTFSCSQVAPYSNNDLDILAAQRTDVLLNRTFIEPLLGLGYPSKEVSILVQMEKYMQQHDEQKLAFDMDFIGIQNYTREVVKHSYFMPYINARIIKADKRNVETTLMNWEIYPPCIYNMLKQYAAYDSIKEIIVTENGAAFPDKIIDGVIHDCRRMSYIQAHLQQVLQAKHDGVPVTGYFIWSFLDNFEWAEGYRPRFGLVYVDFETQKRIIKSSGKWYSRFLAE